MKSSGRPLGYDAMPMAATTPPTLGKDALRTCRLFARVDDARLATVASSLRARRFRDGETIFHQGDLGDSLHVVSRGAVKIVLPSAEDQEPVIVATLKPGDFFGVLALLDDTPRSATAVAHGATETLVLRREAFLALLDDDRSLRRALLAALADEIRSITAHVQDLHFLDLPGRLAARILREADRAALAAAPDADGPRGTTRDGAARLPWPYTQSELAGMIGGSRQSVNRLLGDLTGRGLVRLERDVLVILDRPGLEAAARR